MPVVLPLALLLLASMAGAQKEDEAAKAAVPRQHPLTGMPGEAPGIETTFIFPDHNTKVPQFPAGAAIDVIAGFHNGASQPYNVTAIMGSLNSPLDFGIFVQNFTYQTYGLQVNPDSEVSLLYSFRPDPALHPREFTVALTIFYMSHQGQMSTTTFFNSTIEIVEPPRSIDGEILFLWLMLLSAVGFAGYKAYSFLAKTLLKGGKSRRKAAAPVDNTTDEWLHGTSLAAERKQAAKAAAKAAAAEKTE